MMYFNYKKIVISLCLCFGLAYLLVPPPCPLNSPLWFQNLSVFFRELSLKVFTVHTPAPDIFVLEFLEEELPLYLNRLDVYLESLKNLPFDDLTGQSEAFRCLFMIKAIVQALQPFAFILADAIPPVSAAAPAPVPTSTFFSDLTLTNVFARLSTIITDLSLINLAFQLVELINFCLQLNTDTTSASTSDTAPVFIIIKTLTLINLSAHFAELMNTCLQLNTDINPALLTRVLLLVLYQSFIKIKAMPCPSDIDLNFEVKSTLTADVVKFLESNAQVLNLIYDLDTHIIVVNHPVIMSLTKIVLSNFNLI